MQDHIHRRFGEFSDLDIEAYLVGDLPSEQARRIETAAAASADLAAHLADRRQDQQAFAALHPFPGTEALEREPARPKRRLAWALALSGALGATAAALWLVFLPPAPIAPPEGQPTQTIRARGALKAALVVRRDGRIFTYRDGVLLRRGDQVRLTIESPNGGYLTLLGRDARGRITTYYDGLRAHAGTFTVPDSLVLDESLAAEEWLVLLSDQRTSVEEFTQRLGAEQALEAAASIIHIAKEAAP